MQKPLLTIVTTLLLGSSSYAADLAPQANGDFDTYVLALSWQTGFCQMQNDAGKHPTECQNQQSSAAPLSFLTIHGMWPSLPTSVAKKGINEKRWRNQGCAAIGYPDASADNKCGAADVPMSPEFKKDLLNYMPGSNSSSCLQKYEYAKHGVCFAFPPEDYFGTMIRLDSEIRTSPIGAFITENYGKSVEKTAFMQAIEKAYGAAAKGAVKLSCASHNGQQYLTEMQIALKADHINKSLSEASFTAASGSSGCEQSFVLDAVGF